MNNYSEAIKNILDTISSSIDSINSNYLDDAAQHLQAISNPLIYLKLTAKSYQEHAQKQLDYSDHQLSELTEAIGSHDQHLQELETKLRALDSERKILANKQDITIEEVQDLRSSMKQIRKEIDNKQKKVKIWGGLSIFGGVIGVTALLIAISELNKQLKSKSDEIGRLNEELGKDKADLKKTQELLAQVDLTLNTTKVDIEQLKELLPLLEKRKPLFAEQVVLFSDIQLFCKQTGQSIIDIHSKRNDALDAVLYTLSKPVTVAGMGYVDSEVMHLKDALLHFGDYLDSGAADHKQPRFIKLEGDAIGFYPYSYQLASRQDVEARAQEAYAVLDRWDICRLQDGYALKGSGYHYLFEEYEAHSLGHTLCVLIDNNDELIIGRNHFILMDSHYTVTTFCIKNNKLTCKVYNKSSKEDKQLWQMDKATIQTILDDPEGKIMITNTSRYSDCGLLSLGEYGRLLFLHKSFPNHQALREEMIVVLMQAREYSK